MTFNFQGDWPILLIILVVAVLLGALVYYNIREHFRTVKKNKENNPSDS